MSKVVVYLANGFEEIEALAVVDILRRAEIHVDMVSITDSLEVVGGHDIKVIADKVITDISPTNYDMIVLPGGMPGTTNLDNCEILRNHILEFDKDKKYVSAICAAPSIIGKMGLLEGREATCYPGVEEKLLKANYTSCASVVTSDNFITSRGAGTAMEFGIELVKTLKSSEFAKLLAEKLIMR